MNATAALILCAWLICSGAMADTACFSRPEAAADAALRYEALLRVTGLTCDSFKQYQLFATNNRKRYEAAVATMHGGGTDEASDLYDEYETGLQNTESFQAASTGAADYCRHNASLLNDAELDSAGQVDRAIADFAITNPGPVKLCR